MANGQIGEAAVGMYEACRPYMGLHTSYIGWENLTAGFALQGKGPVLAFSTPV